MLIRGDYAWIGWYVTSLPSPCSDEGVVMLVGRKLCRLRTDLFTLNFRRKYTTCSPPYPHGYSNHHAMLFHLNIKHHIRRGTWGMTWPSNIDLPASFYVDYGIPEVLLLARHWLTDVTLTIDPTCSSTSSSCTNLVDTRDSAVRMGSRAMCSPARSRRPK